MNGQIAFQMLIQNFEGLVETHGDCAEKMIKFVSNPFSYILAMNHLCSMQQAERMKCSHFLLPVEFLCSSHSFLSGPLSLSLSLSEARECAAHSHCSWRHVVSWNWTPAWKCKCWTANKMYIDVSSESCCDYKQLRLREQDYQINHLL